MNIEQFFLLSRQNFYYSKQNTFQYKLTSLGIPEAQQFLSNSKNHLATILRKSYSIINDNRFTNFSKRYQYLQFLHSKDWNKQYQTFEQDQWIDTIKEGRKIYFIFFRFNNKLMKYGSSQDLFLICDQNLHDPLYGSISQIFITTQWPGHCIIVFQMKKLHRFLKIGNIKILSTLMESILIEVSDQKINPPIQLITFSFNNIATQHHLSISPYAMHSSDIKLIHQLTEGQQISGKHKIQLFTQSIPSQIGSGKIGTNIHMFSSDTSDELLVYELKGI